MVVTREQPANEVFVSGSFNDWQKDTKLEKKGDIFEKTVELPHSDEKILYKVCSIWDHCAVAYLCWELRLSWQ